jgi:hypothetical protein
MGVGGTPCRGLRLNALSPAASKRLSHIVSWSVDVTRAIAATPSRGHQFLESLLIRAVFPPRWSPGLHRADARAVKLMRVVLGQMLFSRDVGLHADVGYPVTGADFTSL